MNWIRGELVDLVRQQIKYIYSCTKEQIEEGIFNNKILEILKVSDHVSTL